METPFDSIHPTDESHRLTMFMLGDAITIASAKPRWWQVWRWPAFWREQRQPVGYRVVSVTGSAMCIDIDRPDVPHGEDTVWYRGWEAGYEFQLEYWTGGGYRAYKGGADLDAREVTSSTWAGLLDEIDEAEDDA